MEHSSVPNCHVPLPLDAFWVKKSRQIMSCNRSDRPLLFQVLPRSIIIIFLMYKHSSCFLEPSKLSTRNYRFEPFFFLLIVCMVRGSKQGQTVKTNLLWKNCKPFMANQQARSRINHPRTGLMWFWWSITAWLIKIAVCSTKTYYSYSIINSIVYRYFNSGPASFFLSRAHNIISGYLVETMNWEASFP